MSDYKNGDTASWDASQVRRSQAGHTGRSQGNPSQQPQRRRRKRRRINPVLYILCVLVASAILAGVGWLLASDLCAFSRDIPSTTKITIEITADDDMGSIAEKLQDAGLIRYKWFFRLFAAVTGASEEVGIGTYELNTDMDYHALIAGMRSSSGNLSAETVTVTIPEGYTVRQTIALLAEKGVNTEEALTEAAQTGDFDYDFIDNESEDLSRLEGFLFPDTYEFYVGHNAEDALDRLIRNFVSHHHRLPDRGGDRRHGSGQHRLCHLQPAGGLRQQAGDLRPAADRRLSALCAAGPHRPHHQRGHADRLPLQPVPERGPAPHAHLQPGPGLHRRGAEPQQHGLLLLRPGHGRQAPLLHHAGGTQRVRQQQLLWRLSGTSRSCWPRRGTWSG